MSCPRLASICRLTGGAICAVAGLFAWAGGGPETTLLVVNARSPLSLAVANEYVRLRDLPARQVLWLDDVPPRDTIDIDAFRSRILEPIRAHLARTGLEDEIDLIAYSAGFPYAVSLVGDIRANGLKPDRYRGDTGSLTGLTFFARQVMAGRVDYVVPQANRYFRRPLARMPVPPEMVGPDRMPAGARVPATFEPARGFRGRYRWGGETGGESDRYLLAVMLGYTGRAGNSLPEITNYLSRAAASDGMRPAGTVYLMENRDIRGRVRRHLFPAAIAALRARGRGVEVLVAGQGGENGEAPRGKLDVVGVVAGAQSIRWGRSGSRLLPGAIAESFTSYGGHFAHGLQTKLSEFLRHGASGSSGAVREPYAIVEKFPVPQLHVHYVDGCSLAEAFYQSVSSPYQLLIVGDPLARPFAHFSRIALGPEATAAPWRGIVELRPDVTAAPGRSIERMELWIDGRPFSDGPPGQALVLDTRALADGAHELRLVAVEAGAIETRSYLSRAVEIDNHGRRVAFTQAPSLVPYGEPVILAGRAEGAVRLHIRQGNRVLDRLVVADGHWSARIPSAVLGPGLVALVADAEYSDGRVARSFPQRVRVTDPAVLLPAAAIPPTQGGLDAVYQHAGNVPAHAVVEGIGGRRPRELRGGRLEWIRLSGAFEVRESGLYELTIETQGTVTLRLGRHSQHEDAVPGGDGGVRLALGLAAGWHRFELAVEDPGEAFPRAVLAGPEPGFVLEGKRVRHDAREADERTAVAR